MLLLKGAVNGYVDGNELCKSGRHAGHKFRALKKEPKLLF